MPIDAQVHLWRAIPDHPNPAMTIVSPVSDIPVELYREYMDESEITRAVLVQPLYPGEDNSYLADIAAADPQHFKTVCVVDPRAPDARERLAYWVETRGCAGLRLRPKVPAEAECFGDPSTFPLWEYAQAHRIVISLLMNPDQMETLGALAAAFPQVPIVIDHLGHPAVEAGTESPTFKHLLGLARYPNVNVKVSGFYYFSHQAYPFDECTAFVRAVYDAFGPTRLLWGSDFPHVLLKVGYHRNLQLLARNYSFLTAQERALIMGDNARRLYWREEN